jgi:hypothetical protein
VQNWHIGDQPYGQISLSSTQVHNGTGACQITYNLPATKDNFVVFRRTPPIGLLGQPTGIVAWVYGDGSGKWLNVWMQDTAQEIRQYTFGRIWHQGWRQMVAWFNDQSGWPNTHIDGPGRDNGMLDYPVSFYAVVLDAPDGQASNGTIYLDEIGVNWQPIPPTGPPITALTVTLPPTVTVTFTANPTRIARGQCANLHWEVSGVQAVFLDGNGRVGMDDQQVCPTITTTYKLTVQLHSGELVDRSVTVQVK